jgi:N-methylhydantoinase A/oxoprolinase/acetone carboxylase beta subunit
LSTTLATNTTLEGKGYPAGLILMVITYIKKLPTEYVLSISGDKTLMETRWNL